MKLNILKNTKLDEIINEHSNNNARKKYIRNIVDHELLFELFVTQALTARSAHLKLLEYGVRISISNLIERCKEYDDIPNISSSKSAQLSMKQRENTNLIRYGKTNVLSAGTEIFHKRNKTVLDRYGCSNVFAADTIQEKLRQTNLEKYGVEYPAHGFRKATNFSRPHKTVSDFLSNLDIEHINEGRNRFNSYNQEFEKNYNPIPDIIIENHKLVVEIYGDYWHCNPDNFSENDKLSGNYYLSSQIDNPTVSDIWNFDRIRFEHIESFGYTVLVIWESQVNDESYMEMINDWLQCNKSS